MTGKIKLPLEQFQDELCDSLWSCEALGYAITIAKPKGAKGIRKAFDVWIDNQKIGEDCPFKDAVALAESFIRRHASI